MGSVVPPCLTSAQITGLAFFPRKNGLVRKVPTGITFGTLGRGNVCNVGIFSRGGYRAVVIRFV